MNNYSASYLFGILFCAGLVKAFYAGHANWFELMITARAALFTDLKMFLFEFSMLKQYNIH